MADETDPLAEPRLLNDVGRGMGRPFKRGQSGNPGGRRKGSKNHTTVMLDALAEGAANKIMQAVLTAAEQGDLEACRLVLSRLWIARRSRPVRIELPAIDNPQDAL